MKTGQMPFINCAILLLMLMAIYFGKISATHKKLKFDGNSTIVCWKKMVEIVKEFNKERAQLEEAIKMEMGQGGRQQHGSQGKALGAEPLAKKFHLDEFLTMGLTADERDGGQHSGSGHSRSSNDPEYSIDAVASIKKELSQIGSLQKLDHQESKELHDLFLLRALFEFFTVFLGEIYKKEKIYCAGSTDEKCNLKEMANFLKEKNAENIRTIQHCIRALGDDSNNNNNKLLQHQQKSLINADFKQFEAEHVVGKFQVELPSEKVGNFRGIFDMELKSVHNNLKYPIWLSAVNSQNQPYGERYEVKPGETRKIGMKFTLHLRIEKYEQAFEFYDNEGWNLKVKNCHTVLLKCQQVIWFDKMKAWDLGNYSIYLREEGTKVFLQMDHFMNLSSNEFLFEITSLIGPQLPPNYL